METITIDLRNWRSWLCGVLGLAVMVGLAANIWADIELDRKDAEKRLEQVKLILNKELIK